MPSMTTLALKPPHNTKVITFLYLVRIKNGDTNDTQMKKALLFALSLFFSPLVWSGQGGPDTYGYTWIDSNEPGGPTYGWVDIANPSSGIQIFGLGDDNVVGPFQIANNQEFHFYWYDVDRFWIGSNGYIAFKSA